MKPVEMSTNRTRCYCKTLYVRLPFISWS